MDTFVVALENMRFYAHHGCYTEERIVGQWYEVSVYIKLSMDEDKLLKDELEGTINYEEVFKVCKKNMLGQEHNLIETLALKILNEIAELSPAIKYLKIKLVKPNPPIKGQVDKALVEMEKSFF